MAHYQCITAKTAPFREAAKRLNIDPAYLKQLAYDYVNQGPNIEFPTDEIIYSIIAGKPNIVNSNEQMDLYFKKYSSSKEFDDYASALNYKNGAARFFSPEAISIIKTHSGKFSVSVNPPIFKESKGIQTTLSDSNKEFSSYAETFTPEEMLIYSRSKKDSEGNLLAPNDAITNLNLKQYVQVRTQNFKNWFGDWLREPSKASKVVDENGEPLVVYHGGQKDIRVFLNRKDNPDYENTKHAHYGNSTRVGIYFSKYGSVADSYARKYRKKNKAVYQVFLNIKNPYNISFKDTLVNRLIRFGTLGIVNTPDVTNIATKELDTIYKDHDGINHENGEEFIIFDSNQVKPATDNNGEFSKSDDVIYNHRDFNSLMTKAINKAIAEFQLVTGEESGQKVLNRLNEENKKFGIHLTGYWGRDNQYHLNFWDINNQKRLFNTWTSSPAELQKMFNFLNERFNNAFTLSNLSKEAYDDKFHEDGSVAKAVFENNRWTVYTKSGNVNTEILAEEMLHPLMMEFQNSNSEIFNNFLKEVESSPQFKNVVSRVKKLYATERDEVIKNEIVTQAAAQLMKERIKEQPNTFKQLMKTFAEWFCNKIGLNLYRNIDNKNIIYADELQADESFKLKDLVELLNTTDLQIRLSNRGIENNTKMSHLEEGSSDNEAFDYRGTHFISKEQAVQLAKLETLAGILSVNNAQGYKTASSKVKELAEKLKSAKTKEEVAAISKEEVKSRSKQVQELIDQFYNPKETQTDIFGFKVWPVLEKNVRTQVDKIVSNNVTNSEEADRISDTQGRHNTDLTREDITVDISGKFIDEAPRFNDFTYITDKEASEVNNSRDNIVFIPTKNKDGNKYEDTDEQFAEFKAQVEELYKEAYFASSTENNIWPADIYKNSPIPERFANYMQAMLSDKFGIVMNAVNVGQNKFYLTIKGLTIPGELLAEKEEEKNQKKSVNQLEEEEYEKINEQFAILTSSDLLSATEIQDYANQIVYKISDTITDCEGNPDILFAKFPTLSPARQHRNTVDGPTKGTKLSTFTAEDAKKEKELVDSMNRQQLIQFIGAPRLLTMCKVELFQNNEHFNEDTPIEMYDKVQLIYDNIEAMLRYANALFTEMEGFSMPRILTGMTDFVEINNIDVDAQDTNAALEAAKFEEGNYQERWQQTFRTERLGDSMSTAMRREFNNVYEIDEDGNIQLTELGVRKRIDSKKAMANVVTWVSGCNTLTDMCNVLESKKDNYPWLRTIVAKLKDTSGKYSTYQSQFFGVFNKPFQLYDIVKRENGSVYNMPLNEHPVYDTVSNAISVAFSLGDHPLFLKNNLKDSLENFKVLKEVYESLQEITASKETLEAHFTDATNMLGTATMLLGSALPPTAIAEMLMNYDEINASITALGNIVAIFENNIKNPEYKPFDFNKAKSAGSVVGYLKNFYTPMTSKLEDSTVSSFYESGNMYQSRVIPSYLTKLMLKFQSDDATFLKFLNDDYAYSEWFREEPLQTDSKGNVIVSPRNSQKWRNYMLQTLSGLSQQTRKELFKHKVLLKYDKHNYMRNMTDNEYIMAVLSEYTSSPSESAKDGQVIANFKIPVLSNKPSLEFISFYRFVDDMHPLTEEETLDNLSYKTKMLHDGFMPLFNQELFRIQTCRLAEKQGIDKKSPRYIKSFSERGKKFCFLDFLNIYLDGGKADGVTIGAEGQKFGTLLNKMLDTPKEMTADEKAQLYSLAEQAIRYQLNKRAWEHYENYKNIGITEAAKSIENFGKTDAEVQRRIHEFVWNDFLATANIFQLTITDLAYYKNAEEVQKRLAQIHAPGIRANWEARDFKGNRISDGKYRTIVLKDFDSFKSNIIENLQVVFNKAIDGIHDENEKAAARAYYDSVLKSYEEINIADAQGYSSITSYRKKALIFGKWSEEAEDLYNNLKNNEDFKHDVLKTAFQPLKPFVYSRVPEASNVEGAPIKTLSTPVQFKNSEYLLLMADAILKKTDTGRPNLLKVISDIMEESYAKNGIGIKRGLDTVQFESTTKSGLRAAIDLSQFAEPINGKTNEEVQEAAEDYIRGLIFTTIKNEKGEEIVGYNSDYIRELPFEDYCIQQEVPEHFRDHEQAHGSQGRMIIPSDLETVDADGNTVYYEYTDPSTGEKSNITAKEFRKKYEENIHENIVRSLHELEAELHLRDKNGKEILDKKERNKALSKILQREILSSPRYGIDLFIACSVDKTTGEFMVPLGDPIQSKRVEQLINSIIKNRVNKQEVPGGPVVQVSNFGTSTELNIRFKDKNGGLLKTRKEFGGTDEEFRQYVKENQAGIAYYECFAPIYSEELFEKFQDGNGNIDVQAIEMVDPDLLKMIGYRIPTEDKYSMAPLKIVGFLPREAGEGIMLPNDITLITGSDFDVDKFYLMHKKLHIDSRRKKELDAELANVNASYEAKARAIIIDNIKNKVLGRKFSGTMTIDSKDAALGAVRLTTSEKKLLQDELDKRVNNYRQEYEALGKHLDTIEKSVENFKIRTEYSLVKNALTAKYDKLIHDFMKDPYQYVRSSNEIMTKMKQVYFNTLYRTYNRQTELDVLTGEEVLSKEIRDNQIIDMTWEVLTHETTAAKVLNPGGFETQKMSGYMAEAYRITDFAWEELKNLANKKAILETKGGKFIITKKENPTKDDNTGIDALKEICMPSKNLCFMDSNTQFYKQNNAASTVLGMAAVQKVGHATLESNGYTLNISDICGNIAGEEISFNIGGFEFSGDMELDVKRNVEGKLVGKILGSLVAAAADAVKDPVMNYNNINMSTMNVLCTMIRFGMPYDDVANFMSSAAIQNVLNEHSKKALLKEHISLSDIIKKRINKLAADNGFNTSGSDYSSNLLNYESLTKDELIQGIRQKDLTPEIEYKTLLAFSRLQSLAAKVKVPTFATRFNSISNAVGPKIVNNIILEKKIDGKSTDKTMFKGIKRGSMQVDSMGDIMEQHPVLNGFFGALEDAGIVFKEMPIASDKFMNVIDSAERYPDLWENLINDDSLLSKLGDFYQSYLLVASGMIRETPTAEGEHAGLKYYMTEFPNWFFKKEGSGTNKHRWTDKFGENALIDHIERKIDKRTGLVYLDINTTGWEQTEKDKLTAAWDDLYRMGGEGKELALDLFKYCFFRGGINFNPKTFMSLLPMRMRIEMEGYASTYRNISAFSPSVLLDQFILNNSKESKLIPVHELSKEKKIDGQPKESLDYVLDKSTHKKSYQLTVRYVKGKDKALPAFIKVKSGKNWIILRQIGDAQQNLKSGTAKFKEIPTLGNGGFYLEISGRNIDSPIGLSGSNVISFDADTKENADSSDILSEDTFSSVQTIDGQIEAAHANVFRGLYKAMSEFAKEYPNAQFDVTEESQRKYVDQMMRNIAEAPQEVQMEKFKPYEDFFKAIMYKYNHEETTAEQLKKVKDFVKNACGQ